MLGYLKTQNTVLEMLMMFQVEVERHEDADVYADRSRRREDRQAQTRRPDIRIETMIPLARSFHAEVSFQKI